MAHVPPHTAGIHNSVYDAMRQARLARLRDACAVRITQVLRRCCVRNVSLDPTNNRGIQGRLAPRDEALCRSVSLSLTAGRDARLPPPLNRVARSKSDTSTLLTRSFSPFNPPSPPLEMPPVAPPPSDKAEKTSSPLFAWDASGAALAAMPKPARAWLVVAWRCAGRDRE